MKPPAASVFFVLGALLVVVSGFTYGFDRAAFDIDFLLSGLFSIAIGVLERCREQGAGPSQSE